MKSMHEKLNIKEKFSGSEIMQLSFCFFTHFLFIAQEFDISLRRFV